MKLPADNDQWTDRHLERVEAALWRAFDKYERYDGKDQEKADQYYMSYLRLCEQAENLRLVLNKKPALYP